jgi:ABC-type sugar transport system ATPase subunit
VLTLSQRILVLRAGRIVGEVTQSQATQDGLLRLMAGLGEDDAPASASGEPVRQTSHAER